MNRHQKQLRAWLASMLEQRGRGSHSALAAAMGVRPDAITRMLNEKPGKEMRDISAAELQQIEEFFGFSFAERRKLVKSFDPDADDRDVPIGAVNLDDLGNARRTNIPDGEIPQVDARMGLGSATDAETIQIPTGDGSIQAVPVIDTWRIPKNVLQRRLKGAISALHIVECEGDSMEPRIHDGDFVFIDTSRRVPSPPGIFALNDGFGQTLKRLEIVPNSEPPKVRIIPENQRHDTYERDLEEVLIIGRYLCRLTMD